MRVRRLPDETFQNQYTGTKILAQLNRCQIWLKVITLSDITDVSGHALCPYTASGFRHPQRPSVYNWRNQSIMNNKSWRTWKSCVKNTFTHNGKHLKRPLGNWLQTAPSQHWQTYRAIDGNTLYLAPGGKNPIWKKFEPLRITPNDIQYEDQLGTPCNPPATALKISLSSATQHTMIYTDSVSLPVPLQPQQLSTSLTTDKAILRLLGPEIRQMGDQKNWLSPCWREHCREHRMAP